MTPTALPPSLRVIERGWLSSNSVLLFDGDEATLIDSGYVTEAEETVAPVGAELAWRAIAAPGHDLRALVFYAPDQGILISGDALWADGFGILFGALLGTDEALAATRTTLEMLQRLEVEWVIPGHGPPFRDYAAALEQAWGRWRALAEDPTRIARNAVRACVAFSLFEQRTLTRTALEQMLAEIPLFAIANERFLRLSPQALADWVATQLVAAGRARWEGEQLVAVP